MTASRRQSLGLLCGVVLLSLGACRGAGDETAVLQRSWAAYRSRFVTADGRVVRPEHGDDTVSEGQAYALLRAAWMDDQATFDLVWRWTRDHLLLDAGASAGLMAWRWTSEGGGRVADTQAATDADADAAMALLLAAARWRTPARPGLPPYGEAARQVLEALTSRALVRDDGGVAVLLPGAWADQRAEGRGLVLNPSYLAPAWYRVFFDVTGDVRWRELADGAYDVLDAVADARAPHAPDWVRWWSAGRWQPEGESPRSSWDAVRIPWRVGTDRLWFDAPRAGRWLEATLAPRVRRWLDEGGGLPVEWTLDGRPGAPRDHPLAIALFWFALPDAGARDRARARLDTHLIVDGDALFFGERDRYYVNSLAYLPYLAGAGRYTPPDPAQP